MTKQPTHSRLLSLDIFRGIAIAGMILVNNPGSWSTVYAPLLHAPWHGWTPTDWVFPFFLFAVGMAVPLALGKRLQSPKVAILRKIGTRTLLIFGLGLLLAAFPHFKLIASTPPAYRALHYVLLAAFLLALFVRGAALGQKPPRPKAARLSLYAVGLTGAGIALIALLYADFSTLRIPGVLQRIALVYACCALLFLYTGWRVQAAAAIAILLGYWALMTLVPLPDGTPPNLEPGTNLAAWLDRFVLGESHLWSQSKTWDPEGVLSTLPAIATGILGMLAARWMQLQQNPQKRFQGWLGAGLALILLGWLWGLAFPINKPLWTSSYVLHSGGVALTVLSLAYWLADLKGYQAWGRPFYIYGANALFVFVLSGLVAKLSYTLQVGSGAGAPTVKQWVYETGFTSWLSPYNASLGFALLNVAFFWALAYLLYKRKVYIRV
ncbi:acyltransferase family protein [Phaeodactylibacter luteus]|uniref:DUF5009 domain-containing protein n=1 Tax=Phaeodactylibacter luteus TaxID=1564516 RepID=A0A5C6RMQ5_9BACT|nr:DUF5009 domain-containing protein [Phaeodactylibacter luteus]TXB63209.1 DUF5009 domain-containing protein [Phaeodactylibacter luteus]